MRAFMLAAAGVVVSGLVVSGLSVMDRNGFGE